MKKEYLSPRMKVVNVKQTEIICASPTGTFGLSNDGKVEQGSEEDWSETNLTW